MTACARCAASFEPSVPLQTLCAACTVVPAEGGAALSSMEVAGYTLREKLGEGRFGTSWLAEREGEAAAVVKLLHGYAESAGIEAFLREADRLAKVQAPQLAGLRTAGVLPVGQLFIACAHAPAPTLADLLQAGRMAPARALELGALLAEALAVLHGAGVRHLDLKPSNVAVVSDGGRDEVRLLDPGTAHLAAAAGLVAPALSMPWAAYLSPEEARSAPTDARADLYSLGVLLYQLLTGLLPIEGKNPDDFALAHRAARPFTLRVAGHRLAPRLDPLLARLLSKNPEERPANGRELAEALRAVAASEAAATITAPPPAAAAPVKAALREQRITQPALRPFGADLPPAEPSPDLADTLPPDRPLVTDPDTTPVDGLPAVGPDASAAPAEPQSQRAAEARPDPSAPAEEPPPVSDRPPKKRPVRTNEARFNAYLAHEEAPRWRGLALRAGVGLAALAAGGLALARFLGR